MKKRARRASGNTDTDLTPNFGPYKVKFDTTSNVRSQTTASLNLSQNSKRSGEISPRQKYVARLYNKNCLISSDSHLEVEPLINIKSHQKSSVQSKYRIPTLKEVKQNRRLRIRQNFIKLNSPITGQ
jgi:hypothetical protein